MEELKQLEQFIILIVDNPPKSQSPEYMFQEQICQNPSKLQIILEYLSVCKDDKCFYIALSFIIKILKQKGCIISSEDLHHLIDQFLSTAIAQEALFLKNNQLYALFAEAISYAYRFFYEQNLNLNFDIFELLYHPKQSNRHQQKIVINVICSIIQIMKKPMSHANSTFQRKIKSIFYQTHLYRFFTIATDLIKSDNTSDLPTALKIIKDAITFNCTNQDESNIFLTSEWYPAYEDPNLSIADRLLHIFDSNLGKNKKIANESLEALYYYLIVKSPLHVNVTLFVISKIPQIIESSQEQLVKINDDEIGVVWQSLFKLSYASVFGGHQIKTLLTNNLDAVIPFLNSVFILTTYGGFERGEYVIILNYWSKIAETSSKMNPPILPLIEMLKNVFDAYIAFLINDDNNEAISNILLPQESSETNSSSLSGNCQTFISENKALWQIVSNIPTETAIQCSQIIADQIALYTSQSLSLISSSDPLSIASAVLHLSILILLVTSRLETRKIFQYGSIQRSMVLSVLGSISNTKDAVSSLNSASQNNPVITLLETSILLFFKVFRRDSFLLRCEDDFSLEQTDQAALMNTIISRFLNDLNIFVNSPDLLINILEFLSMKPSGNTEFNKFINRLTESNEMLQSLIHHQITLEFKGASLDTLKKVIPSLNSIYAQNITSNEDWALFLSQFDTRFENLKNPIDGFIIFKEITGVLKGISKVVQFLPVVKWFIQNHFEHMLNAFSKFVVPSSEYDPIQIAKAIIQTWYYLSSNSGKKLIFPSGSADGIRLFQCNLRFLREIWSKGLPMEFVLRSTIKLIRPSFTEGYANFGIMAFFGDENLNDMISLFSEILKSSSEHFDEINKGKTIQILLQTLVEITKTIPQLFFVENRLNQTKSILFKTLDHAISAPDNISGELWKFSCEILSTIMKYISDNKADSDTWASFQPIYVALWEGILVSTQPTLDSAAEPIFYLTVYCPNFAHVVMSKILSMFDGDVKLQIEEKINSLFNSIVFPCSPKDLVQFRKLLSELQESLKRFKIQLSLDQDFSIWFQKRSDESQFKI